MYCCTSRASEGRGSSLTLGKSMQAKLLLLGAFLQLVAGCSSTLDFVGGVSRSVQPAFDAAKTFTVLKETDLYDSYRSYRSVRLRLGVYTLKAEDAEYWYFRSPTPVEVTLKEDMLPTRRFSRYRLPGGIMLAKRFNAVPGAAYVNEPGEGKRMVLEFGRDFRSLEGSYWTKQF
jgi:hypothetical protein